MLSQYGINEEFDGELRIIVYSNKILLRSRQDSQSNQQRPGSAGRGGHQNNGPPPQGPVGFHRGAGRGASQAGGHMGGHPPQRGMNHGTFIYNYLIDTLRCKSANTEPI